MPRARHRNTSSKIRRAASTRPLARWITPDLSKEVVKLLLKQGWSLRRIQTTIDADAEFMRRVQSGSQSLSGRDITFISRALRIDPMRLLFESLRPLAAQAGTRELYESTEQVLHASDTFREVMQSSSVKKRRAGTK